MSHFRYPQTGRGNKMAKSLTPLKIKSLKASPVRREIPDSTRGLYLVQQPSGHVSFAVRYRIDGKPKKLTLARGISLADARVEATKIYADLESGKDPAALKSRAKLAQREAAANTFEAIANEYFDTRAAQKLRSLKRKKANLQRLVFPVIGSRPINDLKKSEIVRLIDRIDARQGPRMAEVVLSYVRVVLHWWDERSDDFIVPLPRRFRPSRTKEHARDRILSDEELRAVWTTAEKQDDHFSALLRFLLLVGCRREEAAGMKRDEIVGDLWTLPASRHKLKADLTRPLSKAALDIIEKQPQIGDEGFVFTTWGRTSLGNFTERKKAFDIASGTSGWRLHDLRRTARSLLARAGIGREVAERCLGHVLRGVEGTYNRHTYENEMRAAYERLASLINGIVHPQDNVRVLRG
jgi:integrase